MQKETQRKAEEQARLEAEKKRQAAEEARLAEIKRQQEVAERQRQEEEARLAEIKRQQEEARKLAEAEQRRKDEEKRKRDEAIRQLQESADAEARAREQAQIVDQYITAIEQDVTRNWLLPPGGRRDLKTNLLIRLGPGGDVLDVHVTKSSGDTAFDRSAIAAVRKASPLPVPEGEVFDRVFRSFNFVFEPEASL